MAKFDYLCKLNCIPLLVLLSQFSDAAVELVETFEECHLVLEYASNAIHRLKESATQRIFWVLVVQSSNLFADSLQSYS